MLSSFGYGKYLEDHLYLKVNDKCDISFISGKYGFLYPGCISCILKSRI